MSAAGARGRTTGDSGMSVQQEITRRVSVTVGVHRNWWVTGTCGQPGHEPRGLHAVQHPGAARSARCPVAELHDRRAVQPRANKVGQVDELAQSSKNLVTRRRTGRASITPSWRGCNGG